MEREKSGGGRRGEHRGKMGGRDEEERGRKEMSMSMNILGTGGEFGLGNLSLGFYCCKYHD